MLRRTVLTTLLSAPVWAQGRPAARKPNIIVLLADDLGYGDIGCYGSPDVPTPQIDSIAANGVRFTDGYVGCSVCSPSRAALLTGRYQHRFGYEFNPVGTEARLPKEETILPQYLKQGGYRTAAIGKWHLGNGPGYHPLDRGFDEFFGFLGAGNAYITTKTPGGRSVPVGRENDPVPEIRASPIFRGREPVEENRYLTDVFAEEAVNFIERSRRQPFLLYLAFNAIHVPLQTTLRYADRFPGIKSERHRALAAMTSALDDGIGSILAKLREHQLERDTIVVFLSDNGCPTKEKAGTNAPLNGEKCTYYEGGIRVPFAVRWPGRIPRGKVYREPVVSRDLLPTFLAAAGIAPAKSSLDGVDLMPHLTGARTAAPHTILCWRSGQTRAIRSGRWKLLEVGESYLRLYDLSADIGEKTNVAASHPNVVRELKEAWNAWNKANIPPKYPLKSREIPVNGEVVTWQY